MPQNSPRDERPLPSSKAIAEALRRWRPPMPFTLAVHYVPEACRGPYYLWVVPYWLSKTTGRPIFYLAAGPAGTPLDGELIAGFGWPDIPHDVKVQVVTAPDYAGRATFQVLNHTPN